MPTRSDEIAAKLAEAADAYYNTGVTIMTDAEFDRLKDELQRIAPKHPFLKVVGAPVAANAKDLRVKLPFWMGSLDKIRDDDLAAGKTLAKWVTKHSYPDVLVTVSDKLDGNSALLVANGAVGAELALYSRGDGRIGQDISHILPYIKHIPRASAGPFALRGELIISRKNWAKVAATAGANARNVVAGVMHSKTPNPDIAKLIEFVVYETIQPPPAPFAKGEIVNVYSEPIVTKNITIDNLSEALVRRRQESPYECDGIVVTAHMPNPKRVAGKNPAHAFAFKSLATHEEAEVTVNEVEWNASKDGYLKPTVKFDPVVIAGVTISKATGFNAAFIETNKIGPGSELIIIRSGDVIPHILRVLTPSANNEPSFPSGPFRWNDTHVDIVVEGESAQVALRQMEHFCKSLDIKHVAAGVLKKLYDHGINTIPSLLSAKEGDILKIDGFKDTMAKKVTESVRDGFQRASCVDIMVASNIFGRGLGKKKIEAIVAKFPDVDKRVPSLAELEAIEGIGANTATAFMAALPEFHKFAAEIGFKTACAPAAALASSITAKFKDMTIVFTGFRNKEWEDIVGREGGKITSTVSKNTSVVVATDPTEDSTKLTKARELGINIMGKEAFATKYGMPM